MAGFYPIAEAPRGPELPLTRSFEWGTVTFSPAAQELLALQPPVDVSEPFEEPIAEATTYPAVPVLDLVFVTTDERAPDDPYDPRADVSIIAEYEPSQERRMSFRVLLNTDPAEPTEKFDEAVAHLGRSLSGGVPSLLAQEGVDNILARDRKLTWAVLLGEGITLAAEAINDNPLWRVIQATGGIALLALFARSRPALHQALQSIEVRRPLFEASAVALSRRVVTDLASLHDEIGPDQGHGPRIIV